MLKVIVAAVYGAGLANVLYFALQQAYTIRMHSITEYGRVIHEFDPYFNYRATEYLWQHGWKAFSTWFDHESWYPLGRPVGTTIYPGMQATSVFIKQYILPAWSINDICCLVPAWFGVLATLATALLCYECCVGATTNTNTVSETAATTNNNNNKQLQAQTFGSILNDIPIIATIYRATLVPISKALLNLLQQKTGSTWGISSSTSSNTTILATPALECAVTTAVLMSMLPAHLMRSVAGGYDNESIAMFAMTLTYYTWCRSLRGSGDTPNYLWASLCGLAYFYMVAAWGGYVFVLNLIGVHASVLVALGRYSDKLYWSYTLFYTIGTFLAVRVPVVGWTPLKSLEQMGPLLAFIVFQLIHLSNILVKRQKLKTATAIWKLRAKVFAVAALLAVILAYSLAEAGYFGPISSRVRGLFVKHTKTGNPLVDSVAEHQPASSGAYFQYLDILVYWSPAGLALVTFFKFNDASSFLVVYAAAAYYFSAKMVRLILLTAPIASVLSGIAMGHVIAWGITALVGYRPSILLDLFGTEDATSKDETASATATAQPVVVEVTAAEKKNTTKTKRRKENDTTKENGDDVDVDDLLTSESTSLKPSPSPPENIMIRVLRFSIFIYLVYYYRDDAQDFYNKCHELSHHLSHPTIIQKGRTRSGETILVDDYREAYWWLRDNTPQDARVMAWWDYGYQIAGIANRTTIADGNTWNHEHIALLGRTLTSSLKEGHRIARHLADYVLLWTGGGGDDVAKSPHMRRIANSVYRFLCPNDPTCRNFGVDQYGQPTRTMRESLLYQLHSHGLQDGIEADKNRFKLVMQSRNGKVRIFKILSVSQESKRWIAANRVCDAPGSWFCPGQYPPALQKILAEKKDFAQLEDFNRGQHADKEYTKQYLENLNDPEKAARAARDTDDQPKKKKKRKIQRLSQEDIDMMNNVEAWDDNSITTTVWQLISNHDTRGFFELLLENPEIAHVRSKDGRGPMWWAHEYGHEDMVTTLTKLGVRDDLKDASGITAKSLSTIGKTGGEL